MAVATCTRAQAEILVQFDHHRVQVEGRLGNLITYPWMPIEEAQEPFEVKVLFNPAPRHLNPDQLRAMIFKHPLAPPQVQEIIESRNYSPPE